jgi:rhodanese-related sulfurtransferase
MGNAQTMQKISFEDMQTAIKNKESYIIINTLPEGEQHCLILHTVPGIKEEALINNYVRGPKNIKIVVYGRNSNDEKIYKKYQQLQQLGFHNVYVYMGGIFEWLLLQDIYGFDEFPTTQKQLDFLKYKPPQRLNIGLIEY